MPFAPMHFKAIYARSKSLRPQKKLFPFIAIQFVNEAVPINDTKYRSLLRPCPAYYPLSISFPSGGKLDSSNERIKSSSIAGFHLRKSHDAYCQKFLSGPGEIILTLGSLSKYPLEKKMQVPKVVLKVAQTFPSRNSFLFSGLKKASRFLKYLCAERTTAFIVGNYKAVVSVARSCLCEIWQIPC